MGVAWVGMELFTSRPVGDVMLTTIWSASSSWTLTALPLFIWMGEILFRTRLSQDMFTGLSPWMARLPGGLVHTNIVGCTVFAAVSGSSAATLTTVGKMSIPELRKRKYPEPMIIGTLAGAATLGLMIPPSLTLIVYGVTINESITKLFFAGIVPGLVLAAMFMGYVAVYSKASKSWHPLSEPVMSLSEKLRNSRFLIPVLLLISIVIGSMYLGFATATEAAAFGDWRIGASSKSGDIECKDLCAKFDGSNTHLCNDCTNSCRSCVFVSINGLYRLATRIGQSDCRMEIVSVRAFNGTANFLYNFGLFS